MVHWADWIFFSFFPVIFFPNAHHHFNLSGGTMSAWGQLRLCSHIPSKQGQFHGSNASSGNLLTDPSGISHTKVVLRRARCLNTWPNKIKKAAEVMPHSRRGWQTRRQSMSMLSFLWAGGQRVYRKWRQSASPCGKRVFPILPLKTFLNHCRITRVHAFRRHTWFLYTPNEKKKTPIKFQQHPQGAPRWGGRAFYWIICNSSSQQTDRAFFWVFGADVAALQATISYQVTAYTTVGLSFWDSP